MTEEEIRAVFIEALTGVAPDISADEIGSGDHLQDDLGLDSMDILNLVTALHRRLEVDIPEPEYPQIATMSLAVQFLHKKTLRAP